MNKTYPTPTPPPFEFEIDHLLGDVVLTATPDAVPAFDLEVDSSAPVTSEIESALAVAVAEGKIMAAQANTVRGGVARANVSPIAGFVAAGGVTAAQAGAAASFPTAASATAFGQTAGRVELAAPVAESTFIPSTPLATDLPTALRDRIVAMRARRGILTKELSKEQRERAEAAERAERQRRAMDGAITIALNAAGGEYPHGCLAAWRPAGDRPYSLVADAVKAAGVEGLNPPAPRSLRALAADAVRALESQGYRVAVVKRGSSWAIYRQVDVAAVGSSVGETHVLASFEDDNLVLAGPDDLCAVIRAVWTAAQGNATLGSLEITAWLADVCRDLRGVPTAYGRWLAPGVPTENWRKLAAALAAVKIPVPARPAAIASREDVCEEIRAGIVAEVEALIDAVKAQRAGVAGRNEGTAKAQDIGLRAALTRLDDIAAVREKLAMYEGLTGPLDVERAALAALELDLAPLVDPTIQRGSLLELD